MESHMFWHAIRKSRTHRGHHNSATAACLSLSSIAQMLSNTLRKPLTLAQLHDVRTDSMADDVDINYDVMKAWTCEQAAAYFESGGTDAPRKTPFADKHVTTCAELLEAVGLLPLEEAISCSPEAPLTLAKIASWAFNGRMTLHERLRAAGVAQLADRKVLIDAIEDAMAAESLVPDQNEKAPYVDPKYPEPAAASVAPGVRVGDGLIKLPDGRRVAYREYGQADGYPIFFLHGNVSCRLFEPMYAESDSVSKAVGARIIAFDRPGIGGSDPHPGRSYATAAADLAAIAGALGLAPRSYAILGFSSGAVHTLASLSLRPGDAAAYGMMSTDGPYWMMRQEPKGSLGKTAVDDAPGSMAEACEKTTALAGMIQEMVEFFVPEGAMRKAALADIAEASKQGVQPMAEDYWMERIDWGFLRESTNRKVWRNLLMWQGTRDEAVHPESAKYLAKLLPGAKLTVLDGYSHDDVPRRDWKGILEQLMAKARD